MQASNQCLDLIKQWEGCRLSAYKDQAGVWTIGYGSTGPGIDEGTVWSQSQANLALIVRVNAIASILSSGCIVPILKQSQFDALVSLCYNIGQGAFRGSSLLKAVNLRQYPEASDLFLQWDNVHGQVNQGLLARRQAERALFLS